MSAVEPVVGFPALVYRWTHPSLVTIVHVTATQFVTENREGVRERWSRSTGHRPGARGYDLNTCRPCTAEEARDVREKILHRALVERLRKFDFSSLTLDTLRKIEALTHRDDGDVDRGAAKVEQ